MTRRLASHRGPATCTSALRAGLVARAGVVLAALLAMLLQLGSAHAAPGNARMRAEVRPAEIQIGQSARLVVTITGVQNAPPPRIPAVPGLRVQSLGQTTSVQIVNGTVTAEVTHNFLLEPERTGAFTIPALAAQIEGERVSTSPLSLRVVDANTVPRDGIAPRGNGTRGAADDAAQTQPIVLRLSAPQRDFYVGEAVPVDLTLYIREGVRVTEVTAPTFEGTGFTVTRPQDGQPTQTTEVIDGVRWVVATFPLAISPVSAGEFPLVGKMDVTAYVPGGRRRLGGVMDDPLFDSFFGGSQRKIPLASETRTAKVLPLPDEGRPASFTGAIGTFTVEASARPTKATVGDPVTLTVKVAGKGNFDRLAIPPMESGGDWKAYPANSTFEPTDALGTSGRKISEQAIVPLSAKVTAVPARPFSYFDPDRRAYVELTAKPVALTIEGAPRAAGAAAPSATSRDAAAGRDAERSGGDGEQWELAPNQIAAGPPADGGTVVTRPWFIALQLLPLLLLAGGTWWAGRRERLHADPTHLRRLAARRRIDEELAIMQRAAAAGDTAAFFAATRRAVQERLARDPEREAGSLTLSELEVLVGEHGALRDEVRAIVGRADAIAYSGESMPAAHLSAWQTRVAALLSALDARPGGRS